MYVYSGTATKIHCKDLQPPLNGKIASCSSGTEGVGNEGETCSLTCNTGYELTGNGTRTCQRNGSWSSSDIMCRKGMYVQIYVLYYVCV